MIAQSRRSGIRGKDLIANPLAAVTGVTSDGTVEIFAPQRGKPLETVQLRPETDPELCAALCVVLRSEGTEVRDVVPSLLDRHRDRLQQLGLAIARSNAPSWPVFQCPLSPGQSAPESLPPDTATAVSNPASFAPAQVVGVRDPASGVVWPFWQVRKSELKRARASGRAQDARRRSWERQTHEAEELLSLEGHATLRGAVPRAQVVALARYYAAAIDNGLVPYSEQEKRWGRHGDPVARLFHQLLAPVVQAVVREPIKPSYPYFAAYPRGASLPEHTDREQCEYTVTMLVGHEPAAGDELAWPICLKPPRRGYRSVRVRQRPGDMAIFKGREISHWRPVLRAASRSLHLFLHFVRADFSGALD
jgi:hypothetical protein